MLKYVSYDIVFREIPDETTLALNLSNCPNGCPGCHSPWLQEDRGEPLTKETLAGLLGCYANAVTCLCFMGGDADPYEVVRLAAFVKQTATIKVGWYSGRPALPSDFPVHHFQYIKLGPYIERLGPLSSPTTNQKLYRITDNGEMIPMAYPSL